MEPVAFTWRPAKLRTPTMEVMNVLARAEKHEGSNSGGALSIWLIERRT
jgi:hypothetical protein